MNRKSKRTPKTPDEVIQVGRDALAKCRERIGTKSDEIALMQAVENLPDVDPARIVPRVNLLTYSAWHAYGLQVRKGETAAAAVPGFAVIEEVNPQTGKVTTKTVPSKRMAHLFHITQTDERDDLTFAAHLAGMDRSIPRNATVADYGRILEARQAII